MHVTILVLYSEIFPDMYWLWWKNFRRFYSIVTWAIQQIGSLQTAKINIWHIKSVAAMATSTLQNVLEHWQSQKGTRWGSVTDSYIFVYDLELWLSDLKMYKYLPLAILHLCIKYESCMSTQPYLSYHVIRKVLKKVQIVTLIFYLLSPKA